MSAPASKRTEVKRSAGRASYETEQIHSILDEGLVAHVGLVQDGSPVVIPMGYARKGNQLLLHGSISSRLMKVGPFDTLLCTGSVTLPRLGPRLMSFENGAYSCECIFQAMKSGSEVCVTVTLLDGLVLARSPFHHSMNYRSVVVIGHPQVHTSLSLLMLTHTL